MSTPTPGTQPPTDDRLMQLIQRGEPAAFDVLYRRHFRAVRAIAHRYLRDPQVAEEVAQEALLAMWRHRDRYDANHGSVRAWLISIAHNRSIDATRRAQARPQTTAAIGDIPSPPAADDVAGEVERRDRARRMRRAVATLPRSQREVVALGFYGGLSHNEIAARTGAPLGTVKGRSRLAMAKLREQLAA